jgi:hypothetical protein
VRLFHLGDWEGKTIVPQAVTDDDGRFDLSTYGMEDGAPVGDYEVTIDWPAYRHGRTIGPNRLGEKFSDPKKSGIVVKIEETTKELPISVTTKIMDIKDPKKEKPVLTNKSRKHNPK